VLETLHLRCGDPMLRFRCIHYTLPPVILWEGTCHYRNFLLLYSFLNYIIITTYIDHLLFIANHPAAWVSDVRDVAQTTCAASVKSVRVQCHQRRRVFKRNRARWSARKADLGRVGSVRLRVSIIYYKIIYSILVKPLIFVYRLRC